MQIEVHSSKVNLKSQTVTAASLPWLTHTHTAAWIKRKRDWDGSRLSLNGHLYKMDKSVNQTPTMVQAFLYSLFLTLSKTDRSAGPN